MQVSFFFSILWLFNFFFILCARRGDGQKTNITRGNRTRELALQDRTCERLFFFFFSFYEVWNLYALASALPILFQCPFIFLFFFPLCFRHPCAHVSCLSTGEHWAHPEYNSSLSILTGIPIFLVTPTEKKTQRSRDIHKQNFVFIYN